MSKDITSRLRQDPKNRELWSQWFQEMYPKAVFSSYLSAYEREYSVQDALQDAFIKFVDSGALKKVRTDEEAVQYLQILARNSIFNVRRRESRRATILESYPEDIPQPKRESASAEAQISLHERIVSILSGLNEVDRKIVLSGLNGDSLSEIAAKTGLSYSNAGVRRHRLIKKLLDMREAPNE